MKRTFKHIIKAKITVLSFGILLFSLGCPSSAVKTPLPTPSPPTTSAPSTAVKNKPEPSSAHQPKSTDTDKNQPAQAGADASAQTAANSESPATVGAETSGETGARLDSRLQSELAKFDAMIRTEQQILKDETANNLANQAGSSAAGGGSGMTNVGQAAAAEPPARSGQGQGPAEYEGGALGEKTHGQGTDGSRVPPDVGNGNGDDIVARQLREAAIQEENPELRNKLWDEYRKYKKGGN